MFITFEGGEGAGKSTQARRLTESLRSCGFEVLLTREPGGSPGAEAVRELIFQGAPDSTPRDVQAGGPGIGARAEQPRNPWAPMAELLLFGAARAEHIETTIRPALERGAVVVCDRFADSTIAYQAYGRGLPHAEVEKICAVAAGGLEPDLTLLLEIDPAAGLARSLDRLAREGSAEDLFERTELAFHERVRQGFQELRDATPHRFVSIDARLDPESLARAALETVMQRLAPSLEAGPLP